MEKDNKTFKTQDAFKFMIILAQCFAMIPINGIKDGNYRALNFRWSSWKVFYSFLYLALLFGNIVILILRTIASEAKLGDFVTILFFSCSFVTTLLFIKIAKDWPYVMEKWTDVDDSMSYAYGFPKKLHLKLILYASIVMFAAALEHSLFLAYSITSIKNTASSLETLDIYLKSIFSHIFIYLPYSIWLGFIMQIVNIFSTFTWNYMDLFIMIISAALAERFKQVGNRLKSIVEYPDLKSINFWMEIREDYDKLCRLCKTVDDSICDLILLSFSNNLFVILIQLLNSLESSNENALFQRIYFIYSFGFLILRTIAVSLICAKIDVESKVPVEVLYSLPAHVYNVEIERFLMQIKSDPSALTGRRFFKVRKSLILSIAGAIVTYELIFIQFNIR